MAPNNNDKNSNRGLALADEETRERVARTNGEAPMMKEDYKQQMRKPVKE